MENLLNICALCAGIVCIVPASSIWCRYHCQFVTHEIIIGFGKLTLTLIPSQFDELFSFRFFPTRRVVYIPAPATLESRFFFFSKSTKNCSENVTSENKNKKWIRSKVHSLKYLLTFGLLNVNVWILCALCMCECLCGCFV